MYRIELSDGPCKSIATPNRAGLRSSVAEHYGLGKDELEYRESDDGEMLAYVGGTNIGFVRRVK